VSTRDDLYRALHRLVVYKSAAPNEVKQQAHAALEKATAEQEKKKA
jgi:hypothetical protein